MMLCTNSWKRAACYLSVGNFCTSYEQKHIFCEIFTLTFIVQMGYQITLRGQLISRTLNSVEGGKQEKMAEIFR